jgi:uncharacterized protein
MTTKTTLIEYPCHFPVKIIGSNTTVFLEEIRLIVMRHFPKTKTAAIVHKPSKENTYLSITATVYAENQEIIDALYIELTSHPDVKMVL